MQGSHHDIFIWLQNHANGAQKEYVFKSDVGMGLYVPGMNTSAANGATLDAGTAVLSADARSLGHFSAT